MRVGQLSPSVECSTCRCSLARQGERRHRNMWGGQTAPTGQPVGMENSTKIPPRRELLALAGTSLCCPWATLHACLQLLGLAKRERGSSYSSAVIRSLRFSWGPSICSLPFPAFSQHGGRCRWEMSWWIGCFPTCCWSVGSPLPGQIESGTSLVSFALLGSSSWCENSQNPHG